MSPNTSKPRSSKPSTTTTPPPPKITPVSLAPHLRSFLYGQIIGTIPPVKPSPNLKDLTIIVTGANSGIGLEAAKQFVQLGCVGRLILACRSLERGEQARKILLENSNSGRGSTAAAANKGRKGSAVGSVTAAAAATKIEVWQLDMASLHSIRAFAERCETDLNRIDSLVLNAGVDLVKYQKADEKDGGYEMTMMVNVVGTFVLASLMVDVMRRRRRRRGSGVGQGTESNIAPPRIAIVGSAVQFMAKYDVLLEAAAATSATGAGSGEDQGILKWLSDEKRWDGKITEDRYLLSKGIVQMLVRQLARKIEEGEKKDGKASLVLNCSGPGYCRTDLFTDHGSLSHRLGLKLIGRDAHVGARALVEAAVGENGGRGSHGGYMEDGVVKKCHPWFETEQGEDLEGNCGMKSCRLSRKLSLVLLRICRKCFCTPSPPIRMSGEIH